ncbi:MAG TPA: CpsB/CapC family capsule biosynthesis tyrosine phosphatase [Thermoanaerobaculia bacterium]|nr:CpsB/CapC family capsule biosynthesis tyrosine phosphatase [Thermoanaerobaculia bacterium]
MIDLHTHILPNIDDGARSLEMAVAMCRLAAAEGCEALVATPHQRRGVWWNCDAAALERSRARLQEAVGATPRLLLGGEIRVDAQLLAELARLPESGLQPLAGSHYLLVEFDGAGMARQAIELVHELTVAGWRPVVAHPELIPWLAEDEGLVERLVDLGASTQVTAMSVTGEFGRRAEAAAHRLIEGGLAHFVASDAHDLHRRPPGLRRAGAAIAARWGEEAALRLVDENPRAVLADRPLAAPRPQRERTA